MIVSRRHDDGSEVAKQGRGFAAAPVEAVAWSSPSSSTIVGIGIGIGERVREVVEANSPCSRG